MSEERLSYLSLTSIERQEARKIELYELITDFAKKNVLRIDANKTLRLPVAFPVFRMSRYRVPKVSVGIGKRERGPSSFINTMSSSFKFGCASCHCLRGCNEEINLELHFFQKPRLMFCSNLNDLCGWRLKEAPLERKEELHL
ncbi:hypothetical protein TNCV_1113061 [Trichonephila clavipes]|nr:hypothetical protein TNCV_1113061 [Trichonephila clavipes]